MPLRLTVKLYGTLSRSINGYDHLSGLAVHMPEGASIDDLLVHLAIVPKRVGIILVSGKLANADDLLLDNTEIRIFQPISGG